MFVSRFNRGIAAVLVLLSIAITIGQGQSSWQLAVSGLVATSWVLWFAVTVLWLPSLRVTAEGAQVRNPFRSYLIPFAAIVQLDTQYSFRIRTAKQLISVWVAPSPGAIGSSRARQQARGRTGVEIPISQVEGTESGNAFQAVNRRWRRLVEDDALDRHHTTVQQSWNLGALLSAGIPLIITIVAALL